MKKLRTTAGIDPGNRSARRPIYYGWVIVGTTFLILALSGGIQYLSSVFLVVFSEEFEASRAFVLLVTASMMTIVMGLGSPLVGHLTTRFALRKLLSFAVLFQGIGYLLLSVVTSIWQVALVYSAFLSVGILISTLCSSTLVSGWFIAKRGTALGLAVTGVSFGGLLFPPVVTHWIEILEWRGAVLIIAAICFLLLPVIWLFVVDKPEDKGLLPDNAKREDGKSELPIADSKTRWTLKKIVFCRRFWLIGVVIAGVMSVNSAQILNLISLATAAGVDKQDASYLLSYAAICGVVGKLVFGAVSDYISQRMMIWIPAILSSTAIVIMMGGQDYAILSMAVIPLGLAVGAITPTLGVLIGINFGRNGYGLTLGAMGLIITVVCATIAPLAGRIYDVTDSYDLVLQMFAAILAMVIAASVFLPPHKQPVEYKV